MKHSAKYEKMNNDLYWNISIDGVKLDWWGYNDSFWWKFVATDEAHQIRNIGERKFKIDFRTNIVEEIF